MWCVTTAAIKDISHETVGKVRENRKEAKARARRVATKAMEKAKEALSMDASIAAVRIGCQNVRTKGHK